jgi:hypothetical protein
MNEYADMYLILGECLGNAAEAAHEYSLRNPYRRHSNGQYF